MSDATERLLRRSDEELIAMLGEAAPGGDKSEMIRRILDLRRAREQADAAKALLLATENQAKAGQTQAQTATFTAGAVAEQASAAKQQAEAAKDQVAAAKALNTLTGRLIRVTVGVGILSLLTAVVSVGVTTLNFLVTQRPYIGVTDVPVTVFGKPPVELSWDVQLKNTGPLPGRGRVDLHEARLVVGDRTIPLPKDSSSDRFLLVPGQVGHIVGRMRTFQGVTVRDLLEGRARLIVVLRVSYSRLGAALVWLGPYHFSEEMALAVTTTPPSFGSIWADGD